MELLRLQRQQLITVCAASKYLTVHTDMGHKSGISSFLAKDKRATGSNSKHRPDCHCKRSQAEPPCPTFAATRELLDYQVDSELLVCIAKVYILCRFKTDISVAHKKCIAQI